MRSIILFVIYLLFSFGCFGQTYEELIEKSFDYLDKNDLVSAEESLRAAMRLEPANAHNYALLSNLGTIQRRQGKKEEALSSYSTALNRRPQDVTLLGNRASLYAEMGETEKSIADYTILLLQVPDDQNALYNRGILYLQQRDFIRAEADFNQILEVNDKTFYGRLGYAVLEKMRGNYEDSERIYSFLIDEKPKDWQLYEGRAELYFLMGKNARAKADINKVISEDGPSASLYVLRGKINLAQYEKEVARKDFLKAQEMGYDPEVIRDLLQLVQ
ncbi:MAG: tetratricopeptide repeat protein [Massilibacteroides sp.]|nr:tetratricopeptide repeat protein [Massilibacteroides sp.]MDD4115191.1 tetratricopeptide repeat protein [Massilibacteroides sp.]MDD4660409.1 tetratricopeptide repeat protein [Massilibacteroides sp.]